MSGLESLDHPLSTLAFCWRLERGDGVMLGLTSHDRDLSVEGVRYRAAPGMTPSAIRQGSSLEAGTMDVAGALSAEAITVDDLAAGRWDGAALRLMLTQWEAPGEMWLELARGTIGGIEHSGGRFSAELAGPEAVLDGPVAPSTSPDCRARLGDRQCRVDMAGRRRIVTVADVAGEMVRVTDGDLAPDAYAFGALRWLDGPNCGLLLAVIDNDTDEVRLTDAPAFAVAAGTRAMLTEGCDRQVATCSERFANAVNFRGEPYLPGTDLLTRYPGA